jgi:hypothetical protein
MALFYDNGAGTKRVIEASPQIDMGNLPLGVQLGEVIKEEIRSGNTNDGSPYLLLGEREVGAIYLQIMIAGVRKRFL